MFGFLAGLIGSAEKGRNRSPRGKIEKVNAWKGAKKAKGNWLSHDEYVRRKKGK